ncbi:pentatricopeptide repeat-containing protein At2g13600 [Argentina anserina]|uniref:pentatricopeptide repeat-containing protein At2g13600 n=1 Tax=Argentina anserina TaxID=57926 RepID=UPI002176817E|nr:pentatricopeptide repeat-containing protein At2g13600 [Potentilla anserina]XP_050387075.1 pentatricopeptide repeat-containing protein At2g13600 [Potentilla anserina]XP_050387076.1 pentatricopeptide repeat-containing protein At2g13600 [Potentilla anserina]
MAGIRQALSKQLLGDLSFITSTPFARLLDACIRSKSARDARRVHARILKTQFSSEVYIHNRLIDAYAKCGSFDDAHKMFDKMPERNTFSWNCIITALTRLGRVDEAFMLFKSMPEPDQCSWNSMVSGFAQQGRYEEALECFVGMHGEGFVLNEYTFGGGLSACAGLREAKMGVQIHGVIAKSCYGSAVYMGSALIDMYSKCGNVGCAQRVFDCMSVRNVVSWNSLVTCYEQNGPISEAVEVFVRMMECGFKPDELTLASVVSACASLSALKEGRQIHSCAVKCDKYRNDVVLSNALVDMYAKCERINDARRVFDGMPVRNVVSETSMVSGYAKAASVKVARSIFTKMNEKNIVSWNALIAGYSQNGENEEALGLFLLLKRESVWPTHYTFAALLNACATLVDLQLGRQAHSHLLKHGLQFQVGEEPDIFVGNSLIDMYMKCGSIEDGCRVFRNMLETNQVSWNAMIMGHAQNGHGTEALEIFSKMLVSGEQPDHITMIGVLCACSHAGLVEEGRKYFYSMNEEHGVVPLKDHYTCMVDLLGRAGCLDEAKNLIEVMPVKPDAVIWGSLLAACKVHRNITLGTYAAEKLLAIEPRNSGPYVLLSNMYAELGRWRDVVRVRKLMRQQGVVKQPGCSWIEIQGHLNVFLVKDKRHSQKMEIYCLLKLLTEQMKRQGYVQDACDYDSYEDQAELQLTSFSEMDMSKDVAVL